jgi:murein DD-endopeptidase MepM/ murein hydrolase activator NlpD
MRGAFIWRIAVAMLATSPAHAQGPQVLFSYWSPGYLVPPSSGVGRTADRKIYLPDIVFPIKSSGANDAAFPNSQVYGVGGEFGPAGNLCSPQNYQMPWSDTYCERRDWAMPLCPTGSGHQGDDIRGPTCEDDKWEVVAVESGVVLRVSPYPVIYLKGNSGTLYRYMHVHPDSVKVGANQRVAAGDVLARISDWMNGKPYATSRHLHFDARQNIAIGDSAQPVNVPPYTSLIVAYRRALGLPTFEQNGTLTIDPQREKVPSP